MMKRIISILSVSLMVGLLGAGCGKYKQCSDANGKGEKVCEKSENFEDELKCKWEEADKKCVAKEENSQEDVDAADKKICSDVANPSEDTCNAASTNLSKHDTHECKFIPVSGETPAKCQFAKKPE